MFPSCVCTLDYTAFSPDSDLTGLEYDPGCEICRLSPVDLNVQTSLGTTAAVQAAAIFFLKKHAAVHCPRFRGSFSPPQT